MNLRAWIGKSMKVKLNVLRSEPGKEPYFQLFEVDVSPEETVLGALRYIYENIDPSLVFRVVCNEEKCGECAVVVNGVPCLACERMVEPEMAIEPLPNLPVIRDLVIDRRQVLDKPFKLLPPLQTPAITGHKEEAEQYKVEGFIKLSKCIECLICQSGCPALAEEPERFAGPLGLIWLAQLSKIDTDHWKDKARSALELCQFCGNCWQACPHGTNIPAFFFNEYVGAPCHYACPVGIDVPRYIHFISQGKFAEALAVIREKIPFPAICGYVCPHPCEAKCRRAELDDPIAIKALKRYVADHGDETIKPAPAIAPTTGKRVAIVGSGPAGLTAAYYLARLGHSVTVFEALPVAGGMMKIGIPRYRLPQEVLDKEIDAIKELGVEIRLNTRIESLDELLQQRYSTVFLALGAHLGVSLGIEGEDLPGVTEGVSFHRDVNLGKEVKLGRRVGIIGGGNGAVDSARTALRLGAEEVTILYRRTRNEMLVSTEEIEEATAEGVKFTFLTAPLRISRKNGELQLECIRMQLGERDPSGRPQPEPVAGSEFSVDFDNIIVAAGQSPEIPHQFGLSFRLGNTVQVNPEKLATDKEGVFAGGDLTTGPTSVIEAIAAGRNAAVSIDKYLGGQGVIDEQLAPVEDGANVPEASEKKPRSTMPVLPVSERLGGFAEVELGFSKSQAIEESQRCLRCDLKLRELTRE